MSSVLTYNFSGKSFSSTELDSLREWLEASKPPPGNYRINDLAIKILSSGKVEFVGRACSTCHAQPGEFCHPDCPELG